MQHNDLPKYGERVYKGVRIGHATDGKNWPSRDQMAQSGLATTVLFSDRPPENNRWGVSVMSRDTQKDIDNDSKF